MKARMDLILRVQRKLQKCKVLLINLHQTYGTVPRDREQKKKWKTVCRTCKGFLPILVSFKFVCGSSGSYNRTLKTKQYTDIVEVR